MGVSIPIPKKVLDRVGVVAQHLAPDGITGRVTATFRAMPVSANKSRDNVRATAARLSCDAAKNSARWTSETGMRDVAATTSAIGCRHSWR